MNRKNAERLHRTIMDGIVALSDQKASEGVELFPKLKQDGALINAGTRINWNGSLKKANVDLWDRAENNPDNAPTLWTDIAYKLGYRIAPETFTSTNAAMMDEILWFGDKLYQSKMDGNVYTPETAPGVWELVEVA